MKSIMSGLFLAALTQNAFAVNPSITVTAPMTESEISTAIAVFNRVHVPSKVVNGVCSQSEATIHDFVKGFNPARWTITFDGNEETLNDTEISSILAMFNRLKVVGVHVDPITYVSEAKITSYSCEMEPAQWTVTYELRDTNR